MYSFLRVIKFALQDIVRNASLSFMTVLMLTLMLLSINVLLILNVLTNQATSLVKDQVDVSVFFVSTATEEQVQEVKEYVGLFNDIKTVEVISKEQVLAEFRASHEQSPDIIASLDELGENPFGATLVIQTQTPGVYQKIIDSLQVPEYSSIIESKTFGDTEVAITRIETITTQVERFSIALSVLFGVIAFVIIFNTIRVAIFTHRIEIVIKKLVGATNWFVRGPYLVEAVIFSGISIGLTAGVIWAVLPTLDLYVGSVFEQEKLLTNYFSSHILMLLGLQVIGTLLLTLFSSLLAMRKHLRA
jgi:cell division transport system permease protein